MNQDPHELTSHIYVSQRLKLHYVDWGNPEAPPMILLHGGLDHCRNWDWIARELRKDYHIIAPDLRGHGDSQWSPDGSYSMAAYVYDLAQLIHQQKLTPVTIVAHSLGGSIALRYAGIYPENVARLVVIEGMVRSNERELGRPEKTIDVRMREWIEAQRALSGRQPRRYASIEDALARMQAENRHLSPERARHLTIHGISQNEDGSYSWKYDNYARSIAPVDLTADDLKLLWGQIKCPTLLIHGRESWFPNPAETGQIKYIPGARAVSLENAGHWVQHDQHDRFLGEVQQFLQE